jgi:hypothetical protein
MQMRQVLFVIGFMLCTASLAAPTDVVKIPMPSANDFSTTLLPEKAGIVSWRTLAKVEMVQRGIRPVPKFSKDILDLNDKDVLVQGFVVPIEMGSQQTHFLISAVPSDCSFCLPAGPDAIVEVIAKTPIKPAAGPVVLGGKFAVLTDDPTGVLYRLTDAQFISLAGS